MVRVFITGSSDGLGLMAGRLLAAEGHAVVLHARNKSRAEDAQAELPQAAGVLTGDLAGLAGMRQVAEQERRPWSSFRACSESKLLDVALTFAIARRWPDVLCNGVEPGRVPTKMGGPAAPDDLSLAPVTQARLAVSDDPAATVTGGYLFHQRPQETHPATRDVSVQDELTGYCARLSGVELPP